MRAVEKPENVVDGCAVVVVDDRIGAVIPAAATGVLRTAAAVYAEEGLAAPTRAALAVPEPPSSADLVARAVVEPVVLVAPDLESAAVEEFRAAGARLISSSPPAGVEMLDAVTVMDRLRSPGGCPWDAEQSHDSLRQYLVEETYELLDAIARRDPAALREELGDVLLQVLFHARVAMEADSEAFGIDEVAAGLVSKLVSRHPHVFSEAAATHDAESQQLRWEELKQREKRRTSIVDGVATAQPAVALAAKLAQRAQLADIPVDLLPHDEGVGSDLFTTAAHAKFADVDPEDALRKVALRFADNVRSAEARANAAGQELSSASRWRGFWPETD